MNHSCTTVNHTEERTAARGAQHGFEARPCPSTQATVRGKRSCCKPFANVCCPSKRTTQIWQRDVCSSHLVTLHREPEGVCKHTLNAAWLIKEAKVKSKAQESMKWMTVSFSKALSNYIGPRSFLGPSNIDTPCFIKGT